MTLKGARGGRCWLCSFDTYKRKLTTPFESLMQRTEHADANRSGCKETA